MKSNPAEFGSDMFASTTGQNGHWYLIQFLADFIFASLTDTSGTWDNSLASTTFKQGDMIWGDFTRITPTSGRARAYRQRSPGD